MPRGRRSETRFSCAASSTGDEGSTEDLGVLHRNHRRFARNPESPAVEERIPHQAPIRVFASGVKTLDASGKPSPFLETVTSANVATRPVQWPLADTPGQA